MPEDNLGAELTIVLAEGSTETLASPQELLAQIALSTGVMKARLFEMILGGDGAYYLRGLSSWPRKNHPAFSFGIATPVSHRVGGATAPRTRTTSRALEIEVDSVDVELDSFLAATSASSVMLPVMVDEQWQGFIQLHEEADPRQPERVWERAEIASLEQVACQLGESISQQKHIEPA
jgi:hypothetical protein